MSSTHAPRLPRPREWLRHHVVAILATGVDFLLMIGLVEIGAASATVATVVGAAVGGASSFWLGRHYTYAATETNYGDQALRYALVSLASLALNALGEHAVVRFTPVHYVLGRVVVALLVSNLWSYPMQKHFVFFRAVPGPGRA